MKLEFENCDTCGNLYDVNDPRAFTEDHILQCPLCKDQFLRGATAWAIWNDCQGVFACSVFHSKSEADAALQEKSWGDAKVVPVRIYKEREDQTFFREAEERNN